VRPNAKTTSLILASASPRRKHLLSHIGLPFQVVVSGVEEVVLSHYSPKVAVSILASRKALAAAEAIPDGIVLAADTLIGFLGTTLGKPKDDDHAAEMLRMLRGQTHDVLTGLAVLNKREGLKILSVVSTKVTMREYCDNEIERYVESGEPRDKAGSYAIQGKGGRLIESISGCYNNVIGLPLCETFEVLKFMGVVFARDSGRCQMPAGDLCPRTC
jgi:septum formation protein